MLIQDVEETVCETPEKEEDCDECDRDNRLSSGDLRGTGDGLVTDALPTFSVFESINNGWPSLRMDIFQSGLGLLAEHVERNRLRIGLARVIVDGYRGLERESRLQVSESLVGRR